MCASMLARQDHKSLERTEGLINVSCACGRAPSEHRLPGLPLGRRTASAGRVLGAEHAADERIWGSTGGIGAMILGALNGETAETPRHG